MIEPRIILASQSPRRRELMALVTSDFECAVPTVDEHIITAENAQLLCLALAEAKSRDVAVRFPDHAVIGCDTVVEVDGAILGKPASYDQACTMLRLLAGRRHNVYTGVAITAPHAARSFFCQTSVEFNPISEADILAYAATTEPFDKAGGYGVQGAAARFVRGIRGDYFNVMGLPVSRLYNALKELHIL